MVKGVLPHRWALLKKAIPDLFSQAGTVLYIGASKSRFACGKEFHEAGFEITLLEIWQPNVLFYRDHPWVKYVVQGDVQEIDQIQLPHQHYDMTFWWHGPEHIRKAELASTLSNLEAVTDHLIVLSSPWGRSKQGPDAGNPHEQHLATLHPEDFERLGYRAVTGGRKHGQSASALIAWKRLGMSA